MNDDFRQELDYWDKELSLQGAYPNAIINRTDPNRLINEFPEILFKYLTLLNLRGVKTPKILDVGSGALSMLSFASYNNLAELTCADPLNDEYLKLLEKYSYPLYYKTVSVNGESLTSKLKENSFDIVWMHNALDHTQDPKKTVEQMSRVLKPEGYLMILGWNREGSAEGWNGLHQNDIFLSPLGKLMCETQSSIECLDENLHLIVIEKLAPSIDLRSWMRIVYQKK
jgi:Methylase involved in ubiquinone/menaquinone biosynthesis